MMGDDIEELKRLHQEARERVEKAQEEESAIRKRLNAARLEATGLAGHLVEYARTRFGKPDLKHRFVVEELKWPGTVGGRVVKADGILGVREDYHRYDDLTDLGLYSAAEAQS